MRDSRKRKSSHETKDSQRPLAAVQRAYSSLSNKRAGWNKRAGKKFC